MNKYFESNDRYISNKRIIEAYFTEAEHVANPLEKLCNLIASLLAALLSVIHSVKVRRVAALLLTTGCILGFVGIVGAVEHGSLSILPALLLGVLLLVCEVFCLRRYFNQG